MLVNLCLSLIPFRKPIGDCSSIRNCSPPADTKPTSNDPDPFTPASLYPKPLHPHPPFGPMIHLSMGLLLLPNTKCSQSHVATDMVVVEHRNSTSPVCLLFTPEAVSSGPRRWPPSPAAGGSASPRRPRGPGSPAPSTRPPARWWGSAVTCPPSARTFGRPEEEMLHGAEGRRARSIIVLATS